MASELGKERWSLPKHHNDSNGIAELCQLRATEYTDINMRASSGIVNYVCLAEENSTRTNYCFDTHCSI